MEAEFLSPGAKFLVVLMVLPEIALGQQEKQEGFIISLLFSTPHRVKIITCEEWCKCVVGIKDGVVFIFLALDLDQ